MSVSVPRTRICDSEITDGEILWYDRASCLAVYILLHVTLLPPNKNFLSKKSFIYSIATALESLLLIGVRAGKFLGADFCPIFPKHARKTFGPIFVRTFSQADVLLGWTHKTVSSYNSANVRRHFSQIFRDFAKVFDFAQISTFFSQDFQGLCPNFHQLTRRTPASCTTTSGRSWLLCSFPWNTYGAKFCSNALVFLHRVPRYVPERAPLFSRQNCHAKPFPVASTFWNVRLSRCLVIVAQRGMRLGESFSFISAWS